MRIINLKNCINIIAYFKYARNIFSNDLPVK